MWATGAAAAWCYHRGLPEHAASGAESEVSQPTSSPDARGARGRGGAAPILLVLVVSAAVAFITLHDLDGTPGGLYIDEVAIALTARSLGETGEDLAGNSFPLFPLSFRDTERPMPVNPVYIYTAIPFAISGPGGRTARLPSVLWCWVAAAGIGLCVHELTRSRVIGFSIGAAAALTPWLFVIGRTGWEAISFPAITSWALWSFLRGARTRSAFAVVASAALFGLSIYSYTSARLLVPLTVGAVVLIWLGDGRTRGLLIWMLVVVALMAVPLALYLRQNPGVLTWRLESAIWSDAPPLPSLLGRFAVNYARYFSPQFLFLEGDANPRHGAGQGMLLWIAAPLIGAGCWDAWRRRAERPVRMIVAGLLIAPIGAAITTDGQPHAIRSITTVIFWAALAGMGCKRLLEILPRPRIAAGVVALLTVVNAAVFVTHYFGPWREIAWGAFDGGKGIVLREAFARRGNGPLYVPGPLLNHNRLEVFVPYWGALPVQQWREAGASYFGIHPWVGKTPPSGLIIHGWFRESVDGTSSAVSAWAAAIAPPIRLVGGPPAGGRSIFSVEHNGVRLYDIFEK